MLGAVAEDLACGGHDVLVSLDERLLAPADHRNWESRFQVLSDVGFREGIPGSWWEIAKVG